MSPENEVLQISSYFRARLNQTGSKFGLKFEEPGSDSHPGPVPHPSSSLPILPDYHRLRVPSWPSSSPFIPPHPLSPRRLLHKDHQRRGGLRSPTQRARRGRRCRGQVRRGVRPRSVPSITDRGECFLTFHQATCNAGSWVSAGVCACVVLGGGRARARVAPPRPSWDGHRTKILHATPELRRASY